MNNSDIEFGNNYVKKSLKQINKLQNPNKNSSSWLKKGLVHLIFLKKKIISFHYKSENWYNAGWYKKKCELTHLLKDHYRLIIIRWPGIHGCWKNAFQVAYISANVFKFFTWEFWKEVMCWLFRLCTHFFFISFFKLVDDGIMMHCVFMLPTLSNHIIIYHILYIK